MIIIDQKINDTRPYTLSVLIGTGSGWLRLTAVWMVVGLVPMSPNTTPSAPPKLQCKTGRSGLGSSRHRLRTPARDRHRSQSSLGRDSRVQSKFANSRRTLRTILRSPELLCESLLGFARSEANT